MGEKTLTERAALWLSARCALEARKMGDEGADADLAALSRLCRNITALRRCDYSAQRLKISRSRLQLDQVTRPGSKQMEKLFWDWTKLPAVREKLFPKPPSPEEQMREYKTILGMDPDRELPAERYRREQREKRAAEAEQRKAEGTAGETADGQASEKET